MRILLINDYASLVGGAERGILSLRDGLRSRGHDARLFASSALRSPGAGFADYECLGTTSMFRTLLQTANPFALLQLRRILAEFQPDLVHVKIFLTQLSPLILPPLRNIASLFHVVWYRPICPTGTKTLPNGSACRVNAGRACYRNRCLALHDWLPLMLQMKLWKQWRGAFDLVVANSEWIKQTLEANGFGSVEVVWNGVPVRAARPPLAFPPTAAFGGRLVREKGVDLLLHAFAKITDRVPQAKLIIAGDGPERATLQALARRLGLDSRVSWLGHLTQHEMEQRFSQAWVQVVPSLWAEPFGIVAAEAMMRGTAVIASNSGGLAEIVRDGETGFLVPPGDIEALAGRLTQILQDRALTQRLGDAGRKTALRDFNESRYVDNFLRLYERVLASRGTSDRRKPESAHRVA
ncbi:MAG TPA: glycosyltransferase family 4 protein [Candidatus Eisenbacteria bacterium]|nr:glycosyltransferase family 4 protein [Candidatus Eisenbacteria bacterium]